MNGFVIAAPHSGSGKTTVTLGIMAALRKRRVAVAPFKVGPDFIDPGYHRMASGVPSINLDGWMCSHDFVRSTFARHAEGADVAVIEGVMGVFDGIDGVSEAGSTAEIAKLLHLPVVLVVDARSQARSAAALVHGFATFDAGVDVAAVIFNNVASPNHERILREAMAAANPGIAVVGCIPKDPALVIPSRHLGLLTAEENPLSDDFLAHLAEVMERHLDVDLLLRLRPRHEEGPAATTSVASDDHASFPPAGAPRPLPFKGRDRVRMGFGSSDGDAAQSSVRLAVARDAAFCFLYPDNLRLLREEGAEICFFSPLTDAALPDGISGIYLPGGYPEVFAEELAANASMKKALQVAVEAGMPVYAECGGFIYLTRGVVAERNSHNFVGIFPVQARMLPRRKALGYREVALLADSAIGREGTIVRGHEFHYSEMDEMPAAVERLYAVSRKGLTLGQEGFRVKNCLASYIHLHFGSSPGIATSFVGHCSTYMKRSLT